MMDSGYKKELARVGRLNRKLSKVKVGLPNKVVFHYSKGKVTCFPKEKKWVVEDPRFH